MVRVPFIAVSFVLGLVLSPAPARAQDGALGLIAAADAKEGERLFLRCKACHTVDKGGPNRLGPNLWDMVGARKAAKPGYRYSPALQKLGGEWDYASLSAYLEAPARYAPGTRMAFPGLKDPRQRAAVIAYLRQLSDSPVPPPAAAGTGAPAEPQTAAVPEDDFGLPPGEGREEVVALCAACHSMRIVTQQGLPAYRWDDLMDWMTETQGMPELPPDQRKRVVDYLAKHFGPTSRRPGANPMAPSMPAMPMAPMMPPPPPPGP